nr:hypothetical protein [Tanacetum cinerariifolium]
KVRREKVFEVDETLDSENSSTSSFQVMRNAGDKIQHLKTYKLWTLLRRGMERGFLSKKESEFGRGVKEKQVSLVDISSFVSNKENMNDVGTTVGPISAGLSSYPPLPMQGSTPAGNTYGMSSYANVIGEPHRKALNFSTLFTPRGNGVDVVVSVESIRDISKRFVNIAYGFCLGKRVAYPIVTNYNPDLNSLKEDVGNVPIWVKLHGVPVTVFTEDGLSAIAMKL